MGTYPASAFAKGVALPNVSIAMQFRLGIYERKEEKRERLDRLPPVGLGIQFIKIFISLP